MATFNTTYNYNQQSMNFGQAMLYGAFGQLTGMGGCYGGYGMGGFGMGGSLFSMMGMGGYGYGGYGMYGCGVSDGYVGAQCGLTAMNVLFQGIGGYIKGKQADKAENNAALTTALNTLNITKPEDLNTATFDETSYNTKITDAIVTRVSSLQGTIKTDSSLLVEGKTQADFKTKNSKGEDVDDTAAFLQYQKDIKTKQLIDKLNEKLKNANNLKSSELDSATFGAEVIKEVKAKEDALVEFNKSKEVVQNYLIDANKKEYNNQLKDKDLNTNKHSTPEQKECRELQDKFRKALNAYSKNRNEANKQELETAYKALKDSKNVNITDGYRTTASKAMSTFGLEP